MTMAFHSNTYLLYITKKGLFGQIQKRLDGKYVAKKYPILPKE